MTQTIETDYFVIGAGAMGMSFADEILHQDRHAHVTIVDKRAAPGGHWHDAYPFVTLHQPALYYGVNSEKLGTGGTDLVSKHQILGYYERVLRKLTRTGRLRFLPGTHYSGSNTVHGVLTGKKTLINVRRKVVDATWSQVTVPATTAPRFEVSPTVTVVPPGALATLDKPWPHYAVIGAGKTALDALLYLLERGVSSDDITWVISRDAWLVVRQSIQPQNLFNTLKTQVDICINAKNSQELFERSEQAGLFMRVDPNRQPTAYRCATVNRAELKALRTLTHLVRQGRVSAMTPQGLEFEDGSGHALPPGTLGINCTANGLKRRQAVDVFSSGRITLQPLTYCQPTFDAAATAKIECHFKDDAARNTASTPMPYPSTPQDLPGCMLIQTQNLLQWMPTIGTWMIRSRLNIGTHMGLINNGRLALLVKTRHKPLLDSLRRIAAQESTA